MADNNSVISVSRYSVPSSKRGSLISFDSEVRTPGWRRRKVRRIPGS